MQIVPPVAGSQGFSLWILPLSMWISLPGSRRGWARGVSGPSFVPVGSYPYSRRARLAPKGIGAYASGRDEISGFPRRTLLGNRRHEKGREDALPNPALLARSHPRGSRGTRTGAGERKRGSPKVYALGIP